MNYNLETPCIVVDQEKLNNNIKRMQELSKGHGCVLRPHIKTHKSIEIATMQIKAGAMGITCAKTSEAEVMAYGGIDDIFIAYPLVGVAKLDRAMRLAKKLKRLILAVDSHSGAKALSRAAQEQAVNCEVRLEIDSGLQRTGVLADEAVDLAEAVFALPNLQLSGLYTFKGMLHKSKPTLDYEKAALEECTLLAEVSNSLARRGIKIKDLSAGSTPTGLACAATGLVNEIRPGTYVFYDQMCLAQAVCEEKDIAAKIITTVVSCPTPTYAVIDGGSKTFPTDIALNQAPINLHSYAYVQGRADLRLDRMNEEHGVLRSFDGSPTGLQVGDVLELVPTHICPAVNLQNNLYLKEKGKLREIAVDARGMLK